MNYIIYEFFQVLSTELQVNINTIYNIWENFNSRYINQIQEENIGLKELKFKPNLETIEENEESLIPSSPLLTKAPPPSLNCTPLASPLLTKAPPPSPHFITPPPSPSLLKAPPPSRVQSPSPLSQSSTSLLEGITDDLVGFFYRIAKMLCKSEDDKNCLILKELMYRIEKEKPTFKELCNDYNLVCKWYDIMIKHDDENLSPLYQMVKDELEDVIKELKPKLYTSYDVSTRKNRGKCEPIYIMKIIYNSTNSIWKLNVKGLTSDYRVTISEGCVDCSCIDFSMKAKRKNIPCKHIYKLLYQLFNNTENMNTLDDIMIMYPIIHDEMYKRLQKFLSQEKVSEKGKQTEFSDDTTCLICLVELEIDDENTECTGACKQILGHKSCLEVWFRKHDTCPMCRSTMRMCGKNQVDLLYEIEC